MKILIKNGTIVNHNGSEEANVLIEGDKISMITRECPAVDRVIDAAGKLVMPGLIDMHVHFRDPGLEYKDDGISGSETAVAGGVTTCLPMANTKPVNDNSSITRAMIAKAKQRGLIDLLPIGAISQDCKGAKIVEMGDMLEAGCVAFSDDGLPVTDSSVMRQALEYSAQRDPRSKGDGERKRGDHDRARSAACQKDGRAHPHRARKLGVVAKAHRAGQARGYPRHLRGYAASFYL